MSEALNRLEQLVGQDRDHDCEGFGAQKICVRIVAVAELPTRFGDFYAVSFWFDACLIVFFSGPYSSDFMRHRARRVTRELANLLPELDDPTLDPVQAAPIPD